MGFHCVNLDKAHVIIQSGVIHGSRRMKQHVVHEMSRFCVSASVLLALLPVIATATSAFASDVWITGLVTSESDGMVQTASVECFDRGQRLTQAPVPALFGQIKFKIQGFVGTHLRCSVSAPKYDTRDKTALVVNDKADLGKIGLVRKRGLLLKKPVLMRSGDSAYTIVDLFVENEASRIIEVRQVDVSGTARATTECLDPRPALIFKINTTAGVNTSKSEYGSVQVEIDSPPANWNEKILASGTLELLGCNQSRIKLTIPYLVPMPPNEKQKIRIAIPTKLTDERNARVQTLRLDKWEQLRIDFLLGDGESISASLGMKTP